MPQQLIYTSAPQGLEPGRSGYCVVVASANLAASLRSELIGMSDYPPSVPGVRPPVIVRNATIWDGPKPLYVVSRLSYRRDHTGRDAHLAHHLVFDTNEAAQTDLAAIVAAAARGSSPFLSDWGASERPGVREVPELSRDALSRDDCATWQQAAGKGEYADLVAEWLLDRSIRELVVIAPQADHAPRLVEEVLRCLPREARWGISLSTWPHPVPPGTVCRLKVLPPTDAAVKKPTSDASRRVFNLKQPPIKELEARLARLAAERQREEEALYSLRPLEPPIARKFIPSEYGVAPAPEPLFIPTAPSEKPPSPYGYNWLWPIIGSIVICVAVVGVLVWYWGRGSEAPKPSVRGSSAPERTRPKPTLPPKTPTFASPERKPPPLPAPMLTRAPEILTDDQKQKLDDWTTRIGLLAIDSRDAPIGDRFERLHRSEKELRELEQELGNTSWDGQAMGQTRSLQEQVAKHLRRVRETIGEATSSEWSSIPVCVALPTVDQLNDTPVIVVPLATLHSAQGSEELALQLLGDPVKSGADRTGLILKAHGGKWSVIYESDSGDVSLGEIVFMGGHLILSVAPPPLQRNRIAMLSNCLVRISSGSQKTTIALREPVHVPGELDLSKPLVFSGTAAVRHLPERAHDLDYCLEIRGHDGDRQVRMGLKKKESKDIGPTSVFSCNGKLQVSADVDYDFTIRVTPQRTGEGTLDIEVIQRAKTVDGPLTLGNLQVKLAKAEKDFSEAHKRLDAARSGRDKSAALENARKNEVDEAESVRDGVKRVHDVLVQLNKAQIRGRFICIYRDKAELPLVELKLKGMKADEQ